MPTGRTLNRYLYFIVADSGDTLREIPVDSISSAGLDFVVTDVTAWADAVTNVLAGLPKAPIKVTGPFDNSAAVAVPASGAAHALSGSHTVLSGIAGDNKPHTLQIEFGIQGNWATGAPVFGLQRLSASSSGYTCVQYLVAGNKYTATFEVMGSIAPAWGTAQLTAGS